MDLRFSRPLLLFGIGLLAASPLLLLHTSLPKAAPALTIKSVSVSPNPIPANMSLAVTVLAEVSTDTNSSVSLGAYRMNSGAQLPTFLGPLQLDKTTPQSSQSIRYAVQTTLRVPPGETQLQVTAIGVGQTITSPPIKVLALATPPNYVIDTNLLAAGGPLNFNNFNSNYVRGGFTPIGGAQIAVSSRPLPPPPLIDFIKKELSETKFASSALTTPTGVSCTEVAYSDIEKAKIVYCPSGSTLFVFSLTYRASDSSSERQFLSTFQQVIDGAKLAP